ncbi:MAG: helix-turn-helix transcriptional regulator [Halobacteriota archaeon]|uniref:helix-turn-helix transcriptional regulator n=1 Tax=Natronomonas sp. TaxID=2184060 RepID=UPI003975BDFE
MESLHGRVAAAVLVGLLFCSLVVTAVPFGGATTGSATADSQSGFGDLTAEEFETDRTLFRILVYGNASAEWTFQYEQRLESDAAVEEFETYAERFNTEETESYRNFRTRATSLAGSGTNVTGREMTAVSFERNARVEERPPAGNEVGVIEMSFVWTGFAEVDENRIVAGDVFVDGLYVGSDQELRFDHGPDLRFESVSPTPDSTASARLNESQSVSWLGERQFTDRHPRIVYLPHSAESASTPTATASGADQTTVTPVTAGSLLPVIGLALVLLFGLGAAIAYRSSGFSTVLESGRRSYDDADTSVADDEVSNAMGAASTETTERTSSDGSVASGDGAEAHAAQPAVPDEQLLSDEERVVSMLESHGGRMKQVDIVNNIEWSKSKVSMLLSEMEDDGLVSKLRVGRENIVSLAGHEPDAAGSPFDGDQ